MLSFGLCLIFLICISVLCVFVSNFKNPFPRIIRKKSVIYPKVHQDGNLMARIQRDIRSPGPSKKTDELESHIWSVKSAGHA